MNLQQNTKNAKAFYKIAYEGNPREAVDTYVGNEYIQQIPKTSANPNTMY